MNLREALQEHYTKMQIKTMAQWVGNEPGRISELLHILQHDEYRIAQRAASVVSEVATAYPEQVQPYVPALVAKLDDKQAHIAVKRNIYRILQFLQLPEAVHGDLMNHCFDSLANPKEALAVRAFSMSILARLVKDYPEIGNELKLIIDDVLQHEAAPSFKARAKMVLKQIG
ncbi:MAG: hypothetical protein EOP49_18240 [Sphingobacteriales bacterium]|nr:MAG: hypothetical protein EOP49_18240 [Sphingobacteriales bacterium]